MHRVVFLSVSALLALAIGYWFRGGETVETNGARELPPSAPPQVPSDQPYVSFCAVGDTGAASRARTAVIRQMAQQASITRLDFVVLAGDNFYEHGVQSVNDPLWESGFEDAFHVQQFNVTVYSV